MEQFIAAIWAALPGIASTAVLMLCGYIFRRFRKFADEHKRLIAHLEESKGLIDLNVAQSDVLREVVGDLLDKEHERLVEQGYASSIEKQKFEKKYLAYHGINGNGTRTAHYEDVMKMPVYPKK